MRGSVQRLLARVRPAHADAGYAMVALLVGMAIMAVALSVALPTWKTMAQREREAELVFRGEQYARAIMLYQRKFANAFPPTIDLLVDQKFLRRKYVDPVTNQDFQILYVGQAGQNTQANAGQATQGGAGQQGGRIGTPPQALAGQTAQPLGGRAGIMGVSSKSDASSLREYKGRTKYNEWVFVALQANARAGGPAGSQTPTGGVGGTGGGRGTTPQGGGGLGAGQGRGGQGGNQPQGGPRGNSPFGGQMPPFGGGNQQPFGGPRGR